MLSGFRLRLRFFIFLSSLIGLVFSAPDGARAATSSGAGTTGATFLEIGVGAKSSALGEAASAWADDVYGLYFNPAGIATVRRQEVGFSHNTLFLDLDYNYIGYLYPIQNGGTLGFAGTYVNLGSVDRREIAAGGGSTGVLGTANSYDLAFSTTYARTLSRVVDLGATLRVINESLDNFSASAFAVDLGAKWRPPIPGLTLGVSLSNLGTSLKFVSGTDELPITLRAGAGYRSPNKRWGLIGDVVWVKNQDLEGKIGGEVWVWPEHLALRAGANSANDAGRGFTVGAGFKWNDLLLDYAYVPTGALGDENIISLAYQFGAEREPAIEASSNALENPKSQISNPNLAVTGRPRAPTEPAYHAPYPPAVAAQGGAEAMPFTYRAGPADYEWIGPATADVLRHDWDAKGLHAPASAAAFIVDGDYLVLGSSLRFSARISGGAFEPQKVDVSGSVDDPFAVWQMLVDKVNAVLEARGVGRPVMGAVSAEPAAVPVYTAAPRPVPISAPRPAPAVARRGMTVAVSNIFEYGAPQGGINQRAMALTIAVRDALEALSISADATAAEYRLDASFADMEDGSTVVYGKLIDRATGIPLANIEVYGDRSNLRSFAARIADSILYKLPRTSQ